MKVRINNIECRPKSNNDGNYEVVEWYPNPYYNKESDMVSDGYVWIDYENGEWALEKEFHRVHSSCFKNPESCCVVAWLKPNREPDVDMETVGSRVLELSVEDRNTFFKVYKTAHDMIMEELDKNEEQ